MVVTPTKVTATQNIKDQSKKERKLSKKASKKLQKAGSSSVAVMPPAIEHPLSPGVPNDGFKVNRCCNQNLITILEKAVYAMGNALNASKLMSGEIEISRSDKNIYITGLI